MRHKCDVWIDSCISAALNWIEFDRAEMRRMNWALSYFKTLYRVLPRILPRALRGCFRGGSVYVSFRFVSKQRKTSNAVGMSSLTFSLQAKELRLSVCFHTFRNFNRSLHKRRMSPTQTITTEWTAEKWVDKRVQSKQTPKHKLGNQTNRWSKVHVSRSSNDSN